MSKYQEFDSEIFDITRIMDGFTLTDGQVSELLEVSKKIDDAVKDGSLSEAERGQLRAAMADCGLDLALLPAEQPKPSRKHRRADRGR